MYPVDVDGRSQQVSGAMRQGGGVRELRDEEAYVGLADREL